MAILKQRLHTKNSSGKYDTVYLEGIANNIKMSDSDSTLLSTYLANAGLGTTAKVMSNKSIDDIRKMGSGFYCGKTVTNAPDTGWWGYINIKYNDNYVVLFAVDLNSNIFYYNTCNNETWAGWVVVNDGTDLYKAVNDLKSSVSSGKTQIASAITDKGVSTAASATFSQMATNIGKIDVYSGSTHVIWIETPCITKNATVTATKGSVTITAKYNSTFGRWKAELPNSSYTGSWTIKGVYSGITKTGTVNVTDSTIDYYITLAFIPLSGTLAVGNTVTFDNKSFLVVHNSGNQWYLGASKIDKNISPTGGAQSYSETGFSTECTTYLSNFSALAQTFMSNVTIETVINKVFIPSLTQIQSGFSHYAKSQDNRICYKGSTAAAWWTSTITSGTYIHEITKTGTTSKSETYNVSSGFRPHICIIK